MFHRFKILSLSIPRKRNFLPICCLDWLTMLHNIATGSCAKFIPQRLLYLFVYGIHEWNAFWESLFTWYSKSYSNISVTATTCNHAIQGVWLLVNQFREHLHKKYSFGNNIQFNTKRLIRYLINMFPNQSLKSNEVTISTAIKVIVFRHEYRMEGKDLSTLQERWYQQFLSFLHMDIHLNGKRNCYRVRKLG